MIIAIDGPAGAGKSTVAKILAKELGFLYIDTGAMYRALTLKVLDEKIALNDSPHIIELALKTKVDLINNPDRSLKVLLDGRDVSRQIRKPLITKFVSHIAKIKAVREVMLKLQRRYGSQGDCVLDGRDIGTVVFPAAHKKFYIDADFKERVRRRYKELIDLGQDITFDDVQADLAKRDRLDSTREFAPLKKADDAVYIDTTNMSIKEVVSSVLRYIRTKSNIKNHPPSSRLRGIVPRSSKSEGGQISK